MFRPVWIEVDLKKLGDNFSRIKKLVGPSVKIIATVKQAAYGHGLIPVVRRLDTLGVDFFGVGSLEEAIALRQDGLRKPILVLSAVLDKFARYFVEYRIHPTVVSVEFAKAINRAAAKKKIKIPVHVKIDTGMGRLGFYYEDAYRFIREIRALAYVSAEGIFTHLPVADSNKKFTNYQIDLFNDFIRTLGREKINFTYQHCANSIALVNYRNAHFNMVRPGLILYGISPAPEAAIRVQPILSLKSRVIFVKHIKKGMSVSYGRTYIARRQTTIATVAIGYADGYPWALSGTAKVIIKDSLFPVAGRICMDHIMVDIGTRKDIAIGDEVILMGESKKYTITAEDLAVWAKTIPYEIVSRLSLKIPRIYKN
ncbi:MAG: alanine racemase [Candidatus Omnitrophota bacterium]|nr:alanine racemase [Candidatus Omnitrophota bacterium]